LILQTLNNQRALITGANTGIGAEVAATMAAAGASVIINYVENDHLAFELVDKIRHDGGTAHAIKADVRDEMQVISMFDEMRQLYGGIDILVNNAAIQRDSAFHKMSLQQWNEVIDTNLTGQFLCAREATKMFLDQGIDLNRSCARGKIICISSVHDVVPWAKHINYAASKGGVTMLMKTMAQELAELKIRVNGISPGAIKTPINQSVWETPEKQAEMHKLIPYDRLGVCSDVAKAAVWLASDDADYVVGHNFYIDGGMLLYPGFRTGG
jgi:glucose 1-dehydrogenase